MAAEEQAIESPPREQSAPAPVERPELRGERSKTYRMPDGSLRTKVYGGPIHVRAGSGPWEPIDARLITDAPHHYRNARAPFAVTVGPEEGGLAPASIGRDGWTATLDLLGTTEREPQVSGSQATYENVLKDTDLIYESVDDGLKETLVLRSAAAPTSYTFRLEVSGAKLRKTDDGGWAIFAEGKDEPETWLGGLMVWDSSRDENGEPEYCADATMNVVPSAGGALISYEVPAKWLGDPSREFPVMIDPSFLPSHDSYVKNSTYSNNNYGTATNLKVGEEGAANDLRSYLRFTLDSVPSDVYVHQVTLNPYLYSNNSSGTAMYLDRVTSYWSQNTITFNNQPTCVYHNQKTMPSAGQWVSWDITSLGRQWIDGTVTNYGVRLRQSAGSGYLRYFYSYDYGTYRPYLQVDHETPTATVTGYSPTYTADDSDVVSVTVQAQSAWPSDVREVQLGPNRTHGDTSRRRGLMGWFKTNPGAGWVATQVAGHEGYFAYSTETSTGTSYITPLMSQSTVTTEASVRKVTFKYKLKTGYGDVQDNDLDTFVSMGTTSTVWSSGWKNQDTNFDVLPKPVSAAPSADVQGLSWFREADRNGDGLPDTVNDKPRVGRGHVSLDWADSSSTALGYKVMAFDGYAYRQVGKVVTSTLSAWDSTSAAMYPTDSKIASMATSATTTSAFLSATSPSAEANEPMGTISIPEAGGAGVVITDGTYLYVRGSTATTAGPTSWLKVGTGLSGTQQGVIATIGPDLSEQPAYSAFYLDGFLYSGYAVSPSSVKGVWKGEQAGEDSTTSTFTFTRSLLDKSTGTSITAEGDDVLLASDGERIYSVSQSLGSGYDGFKIRAFTRDGTFTADHSIAMTSYLTHGVLADGEALYLIEWSAAESARVTKVRTSDWTVVNQWSLNQASTRAVGGTYDRAHNTFWLGRLDSGTVYRYAGPGLDLRDNPNPLYKKMAGTVFDDSLSYAFKVVPYNSAGEATLSACATVTVTLPGRTITTNDDPRHTVYSLDAIAHHEASMELDRRSLRLDVTDLSIASWGPEASLSRSFDSTSTDATGTRFAPGWRFSFDQRLEMTTNSVTYVDGQGEVHSFITTGGAYQGPVGYYAELTHPGSDYRLTFKDRSYFTFNSSGRLTAQTDKLGNATTYSGWGTSQLTITAANGQQIVVAMASADGTVTSATYSTSAGTRQVLYSSSPTSAVATYYPGTTDEYSVQYGYASGSGGKSLLPTITVPQFDSSGTVPARWSFAYDAANTPSEVRLPGYSTDNYRRVEFDFAASSATVTRYGQVRGTDHQAVTRTYAWNPTGTEAWHTNPMAAGDVTATYTYEHAPTHEAIVELSPLGHEVRREVDARGNTLFEWDEEGHRTSYVYDEKDQLIRETDPRGQTAYITYDTVGNEGTGNKTSEEKTLTRAGERSGTEWSYNSTGAVTSERKKIDASNWAETTYSDFALSGEAQKTTNEDVMLSVTGSPTDIITQQTFDAFGNTLSEVDAMGVLASESTYSVSGRLIRSVDASDTWTNHAYDRLGQEIETSRTAEGSDYNLVLNSSFESDSDSDGRANWWSVWGNSLPAVSHSLDADALSRTRAQRVQVTGIASGADGMPLYQTSAAGTFAQGENAVGSFYAKGTADGVTVQMRLSARDSYGGWLQQSQKSFTVTNAWQRISLDYTDDNPSGLPTDTARVRLELYVWGYDTGNTVDLLIDGAQLEKSALSQTQPTAYLRFADFTMKTVDPEGRSVQTVALRTTGSTTVTDHRVLATYDPMGREVYSVHTVEGTTTTRFDASGNAMERQVPQAGGWERSAFDAEGREASQTRPGAESSPTVTTYFADGQTRRVNEPDGSWIEYRYDDGGMKTAELKPSETGTTTTTYRYDVGGRMISTTDADGSTTTYGYDLLGRQVFALGEGNAAASRTNYNARGWVVSETDSDGVMRTKTYDAAGRVTEEMTGRSGNLLANSSVEICSDETTVPDDWDNWKDSLPSLSYASAGGAPLGERAQRVQVSGSASDANGVLLYQLTSPGTFAQGQNAVGSFYVKGTLTGASAHIRISARGADSTWLAQTQESIPVSSTWQKASVAYTAEYPSGLPTDTSRVGLELVIYGYDTGDTVDLTIDGASVDVSSVGDTTPHTVARTVYDGMGRAVSQSNPDSSSATYAFDRFGRTRTEAHANSAGLTLKQITSVYDELARRTTAVDAIRGLAWTFAPGSESSSASASGLTCLDTTTTAVSAGTGLETSRRAVSGSVETSRVITARDDAGRTTAWTWHTASGSYSSSAGFDGAGKLISQSGAGFSGGASYSYSDTTGKKIGESISLAYPGASWTASYEYTPEGRLATATIGSTTTAYAYDAAGSITRSGETTFSHMDEGRIQHKYVSGSIVTTHTFDGKGRRIAEGPPSAPLQRTYVWDDADRLTSLVDTSTDTTATFTYDASGQRLTSKVTTPGGSTETTYTHDSLTLLGLVSESSGSTTKLTYLYDDAGRPYAGLVTLPGTTTPVVFGTVTTDRGDVVELLDASGDAFATYRYDAYGNPTGLSSQGTGLIGVSAAEAIARFQPLRYAGYAYDTFSELYYLSARYYDPSNCQFMSKDPAKADGEDGAYQYCSGDPLGRLDPSGLDSLWDRVRQGWEYVLSGRIRWNRWEWALARRNFAAGGLNGFYQASALFREREAFGTWQSGGTRGDALRHAYWAACLTIVMGRSMARQFLDAHEKPQPPSVLKRMDAHNNAVGAVIGTLWPAASRWKVRDIVLSWLWAGRLVYVRRGQLVPTNRY